MAPFPQILDPVGSVLASTFPTSQYLGPYLPDIIGSLVCFAALLLFPSLNSVGAEVGKPVAPPTASVGVATTSMVRKEGDVIRYNMAWTLVIPST
jgi:L-lactate permease